MEMMGGMMASGNFGEAAAVAGCAVEDFSVMGSYNHSGVQAKLAGLLIGLGKYSVFTELSLEINKIEYKPDISIYPKRGLSKPRDILKMTDMPLLAIEILSSRQAMDELIDKFEVYFNAGIKSCWLVEPAIEAITVYSSLLEYQTHGLGEVVDKQLDLTLPIDMVFDI